MSNNAVELTTPPGRMVWGSLYEPKTKDFDGNQMKIKSGVDIGKDTQRYEFGVAIAKTQAHFANEPGWGQLIWRTAFEAFPGGERSAAMSPAFSWKIQDGDSTVISPKSKSKVAPVDKEGYKGHWVLTFSSSFAPKVYDARENNGANPVPMDAVGAVVPGYVIQVVGSIAGNTGASPGIYLNHNAVGLRAYLPEIRTSGVDVSGKFGGSLPPGASTVPAAGSAPLPAAAAPPTAPVPNLPPQAPYAPAAAPTAVVPAPGIVGIPAIPGAPLPPAAAPAAPPPPPAGKPPHKGIPYASYKAQGWTDEQLRADGYPG